MFACIYILFKQGSQTLYVECMGHLKCYIQTGWPKITVSFVENLYQNVRSILVFVCLFVCEFVSVYEFFCAKTQNLIRTMIIIMYILHRISNDIQTSLKNQRAIMMKQAGKQMKSRKLFSMTRNPIVLDDKRF